MELWDAYYADGTKAGRDLVRGEKVPEGLYHIVSEVLLKHKDGQFLIMQRDLKKETFPGYFEATAVGSALKGEDGLACGRRELREETGIVEDEMEKVAGYVYNDVIICNYVCVTDCAKDAVKLQEGETISYKWLSEEEFIEFVNSGKMIPEQQWHWQAYFTRMGYLRK